jgi:nucleoside-diphosphate-sugar epimerase
VGYEVNSTRQAIVDSWPEDIDDSAARRDFGWKPWYSFESGFADYLLPAAQARYTAIKTDKREFRMTAR